MVIKYVCVMGGELLLGANVGWISVLSMGSHRFSYPLIRLSGLSTGLMSRLALERTSRLAVRQTH